MVINLFSNLVYHENQLSYSGVPLKPGKRLAMLNQNISSNKRNTAHTNIYQAHFTSDTFSKKMIPRRSLTQHFPARACRTLLLWGAPMSSKTKTDKTVMLSTKSWHNKVAIIFQGCHVVHGKTGVSVAAPPGELEKFR